MNKRKIGILMINMGGPSSLNEVHSYLLRIFTDKDIMKLPFQKYSGPLLAKMRTPKVQKHYEEIGGKSPILKWTDIQGKGMTDILNRYNRQEHSFTAPKFEANNQSLILKTDDFKHYMAFRYAHPLTEEAIHNMNKDGIEKVIVFSQYPQYSCSTTGSSLNAIYKFSTKNPDATKGMEWSLIDRWHTHPGLIKAFVKNIREELNKFPKDKRKDVIILFSAHSLPMSVVKRGDPYQHEVATTVNLIMDQLGWSHMHRLVWQSKVGPVEWLSPATDEVIRALVKRGQTNILMVPVAFTSDHIETLHEIDIEYIKDLTEELKTTMRGKSKDNINIRRCASLNDNPVFIQALADIVAEHLSKGEPCSNQMKLTCPFCVNPVCREMRKFFSRTYSK